MTSVDGQQCESENAGVEVPTEEFMPLCSNVQPEMITLVVIANIALAAASTADSRKASTVPQPDQLTFVMVKLFAAVKLTVRAVNVGEEQVIDADPTTAVADAGIKLYCKLSTTCVAPRSCMLRVINGSGPVRVIVPYTVAVSSPDSRIH